MKKMVIENHSFGVSDKNCLLAAIRIMEKLPSWTDKEDFNCKFDDFEALVSLKIDGAESTFTVRDLL